MTTTEMALRGEMLPALPAELTIEELVAQAEKIEQAMARAMKVGQHYGIVPGAKKPSLWKPGAEKLCLLFRLDPQYHSESVGEDRGEGRHLTIKSICTLYHIPTGQRLGSGEALCSTRETKYAYRQAQRICPQCGKAVIIKGKAEFGGGWLCFKKLDGCGAKFKDGNGQIEAQETGRIANPELADSYNTVEKMGNKRALVAAVLNVTACSDVFTQDLEDFVDEQPSGPEPAADPRKGHSAPEPAGPEHRQPQADLPIEKPGVRPPPDDEALERETLLGRISGAADKLELKAAARADLWRTHCGAADPRTVDVGALSNLYEAIKAMEAKG